QGRGVLGAVAESGGGGGGGMMGMVGSGAGAGTEGGAVRPGSRDLNYCCKTFSIFDGSTAMKAQKQDEGSGAGTSGGGGDAEKADDDGDGHGAGGGGRVEGGLGQNNRVGQKARIAGSRPE
nr:hypothetical protein [Tanacetum cinerariifolium]